MPHLTKALSFIFGLFQPSSFALHPRSISFQNEIFPLKFNEKNLPYVALGLIASTTIFCVLVILLIFKGTKGKSFQNIESSFLKIVIFSRLILLKVLFLPIYQFLLYTMVCQPKVGNADVRCLFSKFLPCFSSASLNLFDRIVKNFGLISLLVVSVSGLISEFYDFDPRFLNFQGKIR